MAENVSGKDAVSLKEAERDRHEKFSDVLSRVIHEKSFPKGQVVRFEITLLANGESTYRVWTKDQEEPWEGTY